MHHRTRTAPSFLLVVALLLAPSPELAEARPQQPTLQERLQKIVAEACPADSEPGMAVLVSVDGKAVLRTGCGLADTTTGEKIAPDTIFRIGSITKQFTAVAVLQLVKAGKVSLADPITKYVPDFNTHGQTITIENLLTHTSGIPNVTALPDFETLMPKDFAPRANVARVEDMPLEFKPGEQFKYSNTNYLLLGMVIEKASGQSYAEYLQEHICKPLGLKDTRYSATETDPLPPRHARGYEKDASGKWVPARPISMTQPFAAGAIESTVDDLAKWTLAVSEGKAIDPKLLERAWTPFSPANGKSSYGFGWNISRDRDVPDERWIRHEGGINGFNSAAVWIPERRVFVAVLSNTLGEAGVNSGRLARQLALEALGRPVKQRVAITLDEQTLDQYLGVYEISPRFKLTVTREKQQLFIQGTNQPKTEVYAEAPGKFFAKVVDAQFEFHVENGRANSLTLYQNGRSIDGKRVDE